MPQVPCKMCKTEFYAKPSWLKKGHGIYCSSTCQHKGARKGKMIPCDICKKETYKQLKALKGSKSKKYFCSKSCQTIWRNSEFIEEKHANWKGGTHAYRRKMLQGTSPKICTLCQTTDTRVLAVHHVDENRKNNSIENLAWLCHNCHHLVHYHVKEREKFMAAIV